MSDNDAHPRRLDRRVRRSRDELARALMGLLREYDYHEISVEQITKRANIGRSTFYSHFDSRDDLLLSAFEPWLLSLATSPRSAGQEPLLRFSLPLLRHVAQQRRMFDTIVSGRSSGLRRRLMQILVRTVLLELKHVDLPEREPRAHALAWSFVGLVAWWYEEGKAWSAEAVDAIYQDCASSELCR